MRTTPLACLALLLVAGACQDHTRLVVRTRSVALLPLAWRRPSINVADDGAHVTYTVRDGSGYHVVSPRGSSATYSDVSPPLFAPKSDRVFFWAIDVKDGHKTRLVVADGTVWPTPFDNIGHIVSPPGGARWAVLGGITIAPGDPSGPRQVAVMVDGKEMGRYWAASEPTFDPSATHVAWLTLEESGKTHVVVDGAVVRSFDAPPAPVEQSNFDLLAKVRYLADGRLLVLAPDATGWAVHRDEERLASYGQNLIPGSTILLASKDTAASIVAPSLVTAESAPVAVWWERMPGEDDRWRVVRDGAAVDGMVCQRYWDTQPPVVSGDGRHLAYVCGTGAEPEVPLGRRWVVLDGRRFGPYIETWTLGLSPSGGRVAYGAAEALPVRSWRYFVNGEPITRPFDLVWRPRFSPEGRHVLWAAGPEVGRRTIGLDHRAVTRFDDIVYGPEFPSPDASVWVIRRGRKISRIEARLE